MEKIRLIYILGNSFSGSTLLGSLLAQSEETAFLGELRYFPKKYGPAKLCSCNELVEQCPLWSTMLNSDTEAQSDNNMSRQRKFLLRQLLGKSLIDDVEQKAVKEFEFLTDLKEASDLSMGSKVLIDSSKNIYRHIVLSHTKGVELSSIYLKRGARQNISSLMRHGKGTIRSFIIYSLKHWSLRRYVNNLEESSIIRVDYSKLCKDPNAVLNSIYKRLRVEEGSQGIKNSHVVVSNGGTRKQLHSREIKVVEDTNWKRGLNSLQILLLRIFSKGS